MAAAKFTVLLVVYSVTIAWRIARKASTTMSATPRSFAEDPRCAGVFAAAERQLHGSNGSLHGTAAQFVKNLSSSCRLTRAWLVNLTMSPL